MSKNNRYSRMATIAVRRGRTPLQATHREVYIQEKNVSRGGVEHSNSKKIVVKI